MPPNQKPLSSTTSASPYGYAPNRRACASSALVERLSIDCALDVLMEPTEYTLTRTPPGEVPETFRNGPAPQAKSRTLVAVARVTVRPDEPGVSTEVPVAGTDRVLGWSRRTSKSLMRL